ncbi:hypothetical protein LOAG_01162 [Loa loa]|uniref:Uncharacterized protein n=1 Tax=Loa loa TaxID=7209 RepID=A0A1S0UA45_LOALO|nr:hypothetical protein LOAG_01162 [Loa loa]EFO27317.1 hypothetical protein LOAG_01162 [Loa loa]
MLEEAHCVNYPTGSFHLTGMLLVNYYQKYISYWVWLHELITVLSALVWIAWLSYSALTSQNVFVYSSWCDESMLTSKKCGQSLTRRLGPPEKFRKVK